MFSSRTPVPSTRPDDSVIDRPVLPAPRPSRPVPALRLLLLAAALTITPMAADALPNVKLPRSPDTGNAAPAEAKRPVITPRQAASLARQHNGGGRVLAVKLRGEVYKVKLLRDGEVKIVTVPARR